MNQPATKESTSDTIPPLRIAMWSGPRNISTAMMRAFENRPDTVVWDEPLYGYYLHATGLEHPGAEEIMEASGRCWQTVIDKATGPIPHAATIWYQKHMSQHLLDDVNRDWLDRVTNCFLIREPARVLASYLHRRDKATVADLGFVQQVEIFQRIVERTGQPPIIIDSKEMLQNPTVGMRIFCEALGIPFLEQMLSWPAGLRNSDGVWAKYWYDVVVASTGFAPYVEKPIRVTNEWMPIVEACQPHYELLYANRLRIAG